MALRLTAPSEDILGANYKITKIVASDYNPNIDSTITVTVTVKDVYDGPVENESVQVTCNIGKFTKLNGSTISDTQSVTAQTDSNGEISLTYSCSEWGLATFSANTTSTQIQVKGFRTSNLNNLTLYYDNEKVMAVVNYSSSTTYSQNDTWRDFLSISNVPDGLRPLQYVYSAVTANTIRIRLTNGGVFQYKTPASTAKPYIQCIMTWYLP